jgi:putative membrane protein
MSIGMGLLTGMAFLVGTAAGRGEDRKPAQKPFDDAEFVKMAAIGGMTEVQLGKIGAEKARNADVKKLAERLVADHTKANEGLKKAAKDAGLAVPEQIDREHQAHIDHFKDFKGEDFDRAFIDHQVKDHEKDIALFTRASKEAKNSVIKDFAAKALPTLQEHLEEAKKLQKQ